MDRIRLLCGDQNTAREHPILQLTAKCDSNGTFLLIPFISRVFYLLLASRALLVFVVAFENRSEYCGCVCVCMCVFHPQAVGSDSLLYVADIYIYSSAREHLKPRSSDVE